MHGISRLNLRELVRFNLISSQGFIDWPRDDYKYILIFKLKMRSSSGTGTIELASEAILE